LYYFFRCFHFASFYNTEKRGPSGVK
jgi:hypothetical protein